LERRSGKPVPGCSFFSTVISAFVLRTPPQPKFPVAGSMVFLLCGTPLLAKFREKAVAFPFFFSLSEIYKSIMNIRRWCRGPHGAAFVDTPPSLRPSTRILNSFLFRKNVALRDDPMGPFGLRSFFANRRYSFPSAVFCPLRKTPPLCRRLPTLFPTPPLAFYGNSPN